MLLLRTKHITIVTVTLLFSAAVAFASQTALCQEGPKKVVAQGIEELVAQLNSTRFVERERATNELIEAGGPAIDVLVKQLPAASPEVMTRGIYVLSELALSTEPGVAQRSWSAIETLATQQEGTLGRRAGDSLATLHSVRKQRAREALVSKGARVADRHGQVGGMIITMVYSVEIPDDFKGDLDDFRQIKWLDDLQQVTLRGEKISDQWLAPLADLENLVAVEVKHSKVTDAGLTHLKALPNLQYLSVYYSPVTDQAMELLATIKTLSEVRLFGTKVTAMGAEELKRSLMFANIDYRHGAFLGVGCQTHPDGAQITIMHDGSAAEKAGMRSGDVIQLFAGKKVADFDELKNAIAEHPAGRDVIVNALRGDKPMEFNVKLGEWE